MDGFSHPKARGSRCAQEVIQVRDPGRSRSAFGTDQREYPGSSDGGSQKNPSCSLLFHEEITNTEVKMNSCAIYSKTTYGGLLVREARFTIPNITD